MVERSLTGTVAGLSLREPTEADHPRLARLVREWWDERPPHLERLWLRHFSATSVVAENPGGRLAGLAVAFRSPAEPERGVLQLIAVAPDIRRRGVGRALVADAERRLAAGGVAAVEVVVWPGNRAGIRFLEALGYEPAPSAVERLYGVPATADYDGEGEDRSVMERRLNSG